MEMTINELFIFSFIGWLVYFAMCKKLGEVIKETMERLNGSGDYDQ